MTHRRKQFLVYPPDDALFSIKGYKVRFSKRQAWKLAKKLGAGSAILETVQTHPGRCKPWKSYHQSMLWDVVKGKE